jgi:hypothetical protein
MFGGLQHLTNQQSSIDISLEDVSSWERYEGDRAHGTEARTFGGFSRHMMARRVGSKNLEMTRTYHCETQAQFLGSEININSDTRGWHGVCSL